MANKDNPRKGALFEASIADFLASQGIHVRRNYAVDIGIASQKRSHKFDLGNDDPKVVVECKFHSWTAGGNSPSAKMSVWNEAMYYLSLVPNDHRKMMFVLLSRSEPDGETLLRYYIRRFGHLIPHGVEIWEYDPAAESANLIYAASEILSAIDSKQ